jgi:hypothetical protein
MSRISSFCQLELKFKLGIVRTQSLLFIQNFRFWNHNNRVHWTNFSSDPTSIGVVQARETKVRNGYKNSFGSYEIVIEHYLKSKKVLDFGAANHGIDDEMLPKLSTHQLVCKYASKIIAIDRVAIPEHTQYKNKCRHIKSNLLNPCRVPFLTKRDINIFFAGHVIEHLSNPGSMFEAAANILPRKGQLLIVTPNPLWFVGLIARNKGSNFSINPDHVSLFGASEILELAERLGFKLIEWRYAGVDDMSPILDENFLTSLGCRPDELNRYRIAYNYFRKNDDGFAHNSIVVLLEKL